jgi:hypothetical protein
MRTPAPGPDRSGQLRTASTTLNMVARLEALSAVAVAPARGPTGTAFPLSVSREAMCPPPVPAVCPRSVSPAGGVQAVVAEERSAQ